LNTNQEGGQMIDIRAYKSIDVLKKRGEEG